MGIVYMNNSCEKFPLNCIVASFCNPLNVGDVGIFALKRTAVEKVKLFWEYWLTVGWDFQMFSWLFGHVSATINWEPLPVIFLTVTRREYVK